MWDAAITMLLCPLFPTIAHDRTRRPNAGAHLLLETSRWSGLLGSNALVLRLSAGWLNVVSVLFKVPPITGVGFRCRLRVL